MSGFSHDNQELKLSKDCLEDPSMNIQFDSDSEDVIFSDTGNGLRERRRQLHTAAEQRRRNAIKNGFKMLSELVHPSKNGSSSPRLSKVAILDRTNLLINKRFKEIQQRKFEKSNLEKEVQTLEIINNAFDNVSKLLSDKPAITTNPVSNELKFSVFKVFMDSLFVSFDKCVSLSTFPQLINCMIIWLEQSCGLEIRPPPEEDGSKNDPNSVQLANSLLKFNFESTKFRSSMQSIPIIKVDKESHPSSPNFIVDDADNGLEDDGESLPRLTHRNSLLSVPDLRTLLGQERKEDRESVSECNGNSVDWSRSEYNLTTNKCSDPFDNIVGYLLLTTYLRKPNPTSLITRHLVQVHLTYHRPTPIDNFAISGAQLLLFKCNGLQTFRPYALFYSYEPIASSALPPRPSLIRWQKPILTVNLSSARVVPLNDSSFQIFRGEVGDDSPILAEIPTDNLTEVNARQEESGSVAYWEHVLGGAARMKALPCIGPDSPLTKSANSSPILWRRLRSSSPSGLYKIGSHSSLHDIVEQADDE